MIIQNTMDMTWIKKNENFLLLALIVVFALFGLWLRFLPMEQLTSGQIHKVIFEDPWYTMRQIEVIASNFPDYPWFDPMNGYPFGKEIDWGPLYPTFTALIIVILGAGTREEMMTVASWIPPFLSLLMIPVLYKAGTILYDRKAGVIAACLTSVIAGEYLYRSFYGYLDHHFMEVLFSTAFIVFYMAILVTTSKNREISPWKQPHLILCSVMAGLMYYLGMMNMPTIVLFAGIVGLFCLIQALVSRDEGFLKILTTAHGIIFGLFIILYALSGVQSNDMSLSHYNYLHVLLALILIAEPLFLYAIVRYTAGRSAWLTRGIVVGLLFAIYGLLSLSVPHITDLITQGFNYFFFFSYSDTLIDEMKMWSLTRAFNSFNIAVPVMSAGIIITGFQMMRRYDPVKTCALVWAMVILISTILHLRYEYYAAPVVVLFSAVALACLYSWMREWISGKGEQGEEVRSKRGKMPESARGGIRDFIPLVVVGLLVLIITALSTQITYSVAIDQLKIHSMNDDWADGLVWLEKNSPDPGIDYQKIYAKDGFSYPKEAYGILSWWDSGHWITYLAQRIPVTTPFQNNVLPVARFLLATDEKNADTLINETGSRYIILDYEMISSKYPSIPLWAYGQNARDQYQKYYFQQSEEISNKYDPVLTLKPDFFRSMLSRLYIFDGTRTESTGTSLITYSDVQAGSQTVEAVTRLSPVRPDEAEEMIAEGLAPGTDIVSIQYTHPITNLSALTHYRLIYESPRVTAKDEYAQIHNVKIFERVPGYTIAGTGRIELPLVTNQGRKFVYRQDSTDGTFTLPYSTGENGGVRATGPYINRNTGETFNVTDGQVLQKRE